MAAFSAKLIGRDVAGKFSKLAGSLTKHVKQDLYVLATEAQTDFESTVATWDNPATFKVEPDVNGFKITSESATYAMVDGGTSTHYVEPVRAKVLAFRADYVAKTRPRVIGSFSGGASGEMAFSMGHWVKGIAAREFSKVIHRKYEKITPKRIQAAIRAGIQAVGL